ncbi:MAG: SDR family NAD(P)-dependent oxidoreductase [Halioglobus sp.]
MTQGNCLAINRLNVVIVGNGAIGSALLEKLLQREELQHVVVLGRSAHTAPEDERVTHLTFDAEDPQSVMFAAGQAQQLLERVHLLINTVGLLHNQHQVPEKRLKAVDPGNLQKSFQVNAVLLLLLSQAFSKLLRHDEPAVLASLSARVGSIEDNQLGGWYSYRASKAAHNMLLKTIAREWRISHRNVTAVALHPGTVHSRLSEPYVSEHYRKRVLTPTECACALLDVIGELRLEDSGNFYDWQGKSIPW